MVNDCRLCKLPHNSYAVWLNGHGPVSCAGPVICWGDGDFTCGVRDLDSAPGPSWSFGSCADLEYRSIVRKRFSGVSNYGQTRSRTEEYGMRAARGGGRGSIGNRWNQVEHTISCTEKYCTLLEVCRAGA